MEPEDRLAKWLSDQLRRHMTGDGDDGTEYDAEREAELQEAREDARREESDD